MPDEEAERGTGIYLGVYSKSSQSPTLQGVKYQPDAPAREFQ